jgi:hypothetical protein
MDRRIEREIDERTGLACDTGQLGAEPEAHRFNYRRVSD